MREQDPHTRVLYEMWSMIVHILRTPPFPICLRSLSLLPWCSSSQRPQISPAAFGLLFIGISMALMMFGVVTFVIGFVLMPLVIMLVMLFYFVGIITKLSEIGRSIISWTGLGPNKVAPVAVWNYSN